MCAPKYATIFAMSSAPVKRRVNERVRVRGSERGNAACLCLALETLSAS